MEKSKWSIRRPKTDLRRQNGSKSRKSRFLVGSTFLALRLKLAVADRFGARAGAAAAEERPERRRGRRARAGGAAESTARDFRTRRCEVAAREPVEERVFGRFRSFSAVLGVFAKSRDPAGGSSRKIQSVENARVLFFSGSWGPQGGLEAVWRRVEVPESHIKGFTLILSVDDSRIKRV